MMIMKGGSSNCATFISVCAKKILQVEQKDVAEWFCKSANVEICKSWRARICS